MVPRFHQRAEEAAAPVRARRHADDGGGARMEDRVEWMFAGGNVAHRCPRF